MAAASYSVDHEMGSMLGNARIAELGCQMNSCLDHTRGSPYMPVSSMGELEGIIQLLKPQRLMLVVARIKMGDHRRNVPFQALPQMLQGPSRCILTEYQTCTRHSCSQLGWPNVAFDSISECTSRL